MAKVIDYSKDDREIREQQAANQLAGSLGRKPSQEEIYQQAYGTPYVVFSSDFGLPRMEEQIGKYVNNVYKAGGRIRKQVVDPTRERRYRRAVGDVFDDQDPLSRQGMVDQIVGNRQTGLNNNVDQRFRQYQQQRANDVFDYLRGNQKLQSAYGDVQVQEQRQQNLEDYAKQRQIDAQYSRSGGGGGAGFQFKTLSDGTYGVFDPSSGAFIPVGQVQQEISATPTFEQWLGTLNYTPDVSNPVVLGDLQKNFNQYLIDNGFKNNNQDLLSAMLGATSGAMSSQNNQSIAPVNPFEIPQ